MLNRVMEETIRRAIRTFPAVLVTGPRQSGKTTLLKMGWSRSHRFVPLENPDIRARALADPVGFLRDNPPPAILDEIQYVPELLPYIKTAIDENRSPGMWLLTGSQSFSLMQGVSESLAGRVAVVTLLPLSLDEAIGTADKSLSMATHLSKIWAGFLDRSAPSFNISEWLLRGAYPEVRTNLKVDRDLWCAGYVQTYLERDVRQVVNVGDLNAFSRFLRLVAARTGQVVNYSDLARDVGITAPSARKWMSVLETSGQVYLLPPYFENFGKRLIKSPKIYWLDTSVATYLIGLHSSEPLMHGPYLGPLFETAIVSAWVKAFYNRGLPPSLYFWRSRDGIEVDLLIDYDGKLHPLEIKATSTVVPQHASALNKWGALAGKHQEKSIIVANISDPISVSPGIRAVPWWWI
jgi:uncharacterized protein